MAEAVKGPEIEQVSPFIYSWQEVKYTNLHQHSSFSNMGMLDAYGTIPQIVEQCVKTRASAAALTDHGSTSGHIKLIRSCRDHNIKPICGCEMYVVDSLKTLQEVRDQIKQKDTDAVLTDENQIYSEDERAKARQKNHFNVLAKNQQGLLDLWNLLTSAWGEWYYFKPSVDWDLLESKKENLLFGTACEIGPLWRLLDKYQFKIKLEKDALLTTLIEPCEKKDSQIHELKKDIRSLHETMKKLEKEFKLTGDLEKDFVNQIKLKKEQVYDIEQAYEELVEGAELLKYIEVKEIEDKYYAEASIAIEEKLIDLRNRFGDSLYVEVIPVKEKRARWKYLLSYYAAKKLGIRVLATNDSHAPTKADTLYQDILYTANIYRSDKEVRFNDRDRSRYSPELFYIHSAEEMFNRLKDVFPEFTDENIIELLNNTEEIVNLIETVKEPQVPAVQFKELSDMPWQRPTNLYRKMQKLLHEGWLFREFDKMDKEKQWIYMARVKRELEVILYKGYIDYFMIMSDIMDWCDKWRPFIENFKKWYTLNGMNYIESEEMLLKKFDEVWFFNHRASIGTGIARWSAWGSLVTYLMRITNIDPMPGDLLFERFIDYTRWDVYYQLDFEKYKKSLFLKDFPEENKERLEELETKYRPLAEQAMNELLARDEWYDKLQILREFWLLDHNQKFSREKEYFYTILEKVSLQEIESSKTNKSNSILSWALWITTKEQEGDYVVSLTDIPDIDSDFEDVRRNEVYTYLQHRYGVANSCRIATYTMLKVPSAIDLLSKIFDSEWRDIIELKKNAEQYEKENGLEELKVKFVDDFFEGPLWKPFYDKYDWLKHVKPLMWQVVAWGMHAAGMIVHNNDVSQYWAIYRNTDKETGERMTVICWDSIEAESMWLMKLDLLWLNTVTNLKKINELVEKRHWFEHHWQRIPNVFEDKKTKELMKRADMAWLFQLEWRIMLHLSKQIMPEDFEEIVFILAGWRPGPLQDALEYADIKFWRKQPYYYNNKFYEDITKRWWGKVIYQEDLMKIAWQMCWYDIAMVGKIRKLVSKVQREAIRKLEPDFVGRLMNHAGMNEEEAQKLWVSICNFWAYAFNKAHAAAYWMLSWIGAYYKANYTLEFYCGMLQTLGQVSWKVEGTEKDKVFMLLNDYKDHGYKLLYPDINRSEISFNIDKNEKTNEELIRVWFNYIKWVGPKQAVEIAKKQPYTDYYDFLKKVDRRVVNSKIVQIVKQMWLFNNIWWAPDIDEKLVPEVNSIELIRELCLKLLEVLKDIREWNETTNDIIEGEEKSNSLIELYELMWIDEEKYPETDIREIDYSDVRKIMNKIKAKLKSLTDKINKKKPFYDQLEKYSEEGNTLKDLIDSKLKYIEDEFKILTKVKAKRPKDKQLTIWDIDKHRLFEDKYSQDLDLIDFISKLDKLEDLSFKEVAELEWIKSNYFEVMLSSIELEPDLQSIIQYIDKIITEVDLDKTCVQIHPSITYTMKTCSILLNVDLKEYAPIVPSLTRFVPLKYITFKDDIKYWTSVWVIMNKTILTDVMKEDWSWVNYNKTKVKASIMIGDLKLPLFINWHTYIKNKLILDEIEPGDPVIIRFNISQWFTMIQLQDIIRAEEFKRKLDNKIPFDEREQKFLKSVN